MKKMMQMLVVSQKFRSIFLDIFVFLIICCINEIQHPVVLVVSGPAADDDLGTAEVAF